MHHTVNHYISKLNEYAQKARLDLRYEDVGCDGLDHIRTFTVRAVLDGKTYDGVGKNKKEAKLKAAENAFSVLSEGTIDPTEKTTEASAAPTDQTSIPQAKYTCWLNEYGQQKRSDIRAVESTRLGPTGATQCCRFVVGDKEYPAATGRTKKDAKEEAAKLVYHEICGGNTTESSSQQNIAYCEGRLIWDLRCIYVELIIGCIFLVPITKIKSPDVKPKIRIAANFANACRNSKEVHLPQQYLCYLNRFTTEYDSMVSLGKGTFGRVFRAKQKLLKKYYAVKIVRCKEIKKALREVMALSDLHHCNIVRYYSCWLEDSGYQWDSGDDSSSSSQSTDNTSVKYLYIQMELCDTKTLRVWIDEKNTQNVKKSLRDSKRREESLTIAQQIVSAVEYFHSKMLIHRDLKPANILFGQDGEVKIGDFGLVTEENNVDAENLLERTVYKGTPSYMAPEQRSRSIYDRKVDIFALGLVYFELLWNIFTGPEKKAIWEDARIQQFPEGFQHNFPLEITIIKSMLCQKSEDRPEASKLKQDLEKCSQTITMLKDARRLSRTV
uniref:non-specific serine/threonine protein kinase n=1 Tax=Cyclopterus lumpus TaxID=8103 RepID=A0A8C3AUJ9_CYCLU